MGTVTSLSLDFIRAEDAEDQYAFRLGAQEYVLRGAGGGVENLELQWNQALLADLAALHQPGCDPAVIQRVGRTLRGFLRSDDWARQEALLLAAVSSEQPVFVTIRSAAAELYALPWELLTLGASGQHLGELPSVIVRYEWPETRTTAESPSPRPEGGRVLFAWSSAGGGVPVVEHLRAIQEGARAGHHSFDPKGDVLERATYGRLDDVLKAAKAPGGKPISVLHLLCHGGAVGQTCGLVLNSESEGTPTVVDAGRLRQLLAPYAGMVRLVVIAACNGGNIGTLGNQLGSVAQALHQIGIASVIASRFPLSIPGSNRFSETFYRELFGGPSSVETAFLAARRQLARDTSQLDWASMQLYARDADGHDNRPIVLRPYRGLLAFQPEHSRFFFGRDSEINEIITDLGALVKAGAPRFLVITGSSGTGKSSVVLAGAVPRMLQTPGFTWVFARMRPGVEPLAALDAALAARTEQDRPLLLVVDQFEEVFTQTESAEERNTFVRRLWALAGDAASGVSVLVTLRVDFIGRCGELMLDDNGLRLDKVAYDEAHRVFVAQMAQAQIEEAISKPAQLVGLTLEAGLARRMLKDVEGEPGALPLLQDTLDMLWQQRKGRMLTQAAYDAAGGVSGALSLRADARIDELGEAERMIARRLLLRLVSVHSDTAMDTRRRAPLAEVKPRDAENGARFDQILARLVDERLLVRTGDGEATTVEVAHEALIRNWQRLRGWLREDRGKLLARQELESKVEEWKKHGALLNERQLNLAEVVERDSSEELGDDARKLLEESRAAARRKRRVQQFAVAGIAAAAVGFAVLGLWGQKKAHEATAQADLAKKQARQARDTSRVSAARQVAGKPELVAAILREVESQDPGQVLGWLEAAPHFTSQVFLSEHELEGPAEEVLLYAGFRPEGTRIVTASREGTARVWKADGALVAELKGHERPVNSATFSPDGTHIVTASWDGTARVWKADGTSIAVLNHRKQVESETVSPNGARVGTSSVDNAARVWESGGTLFGVLPGHEESVISATFSPDGTHIVTSSNDGTARVWKADGTHLAALKGHEESVNSATFSPDGTHIVTSSNDGTARVWKTDGTQVATLKHGQAVNSAEFSPDGTLVVTSSFDNTARVWKADGTQVAKLNHEGGVRSATFSPKGTRIATSSHDGTARVWRVDGTSIATLRGHTDLVWSAAFSADETRIVTASADRTARVWTADGIPLAVLEGHDDQVESAEFSPDGTRIITASSDRTARVWKAAETLGTVLIGHSDGVNAAVFSPDGTRVATASHDKTGRVWKADDGTIVAVLEGHKGPVRSATFSHDGKSVVTASDDGTARIWKAGDGTQGPVLNGLERGMDIAAFSPDNTRVTISNRFTGSGKMWTSIDGTFLAGIKSDDGRLMAVGSDGTYFTWSGSGAGGVAKIRKADGGLLAEFKDPEGKMERAAFSPDSKRIVIATNDGNADVRTVDGTVVTTLKGCSRKTSDIIFSANGQFVAMRAAGEETVKVWKLDDGGHVNELKGHKGVVLSVAFSPDGKRVVTASTDRTVRVWTADDGTPVAILKGHRANVDSAAFSPDGTRVVSASSDKTARVWTVDPYTVWRQLWLLTPFCLDPSERSRLLGESDDYARQGHADCQAMTRCLRDDNGLVVPSKYKDCLEQFRKAQDTRYLVK